MLHGDRAERRQRLRTDGACARSGTGASAHAPTRPLRAARACPRSSSRCRAGRGRGRGRRGAASQTASRARPSCAPGPAASSATAGAWPRVYGDLRSTKFAIARSAASKLLAREHDGERRLGVDHRVPGADGIEVREDHLGLRRHEPRELGIELLAGALARERLRGLDASDPVRDLGELARAARASPRAERPRPRGRPASRARPTARTPRRARRATPLGQLELLAQRTRDGGVVGDHVVDLLAAGERELEPDPEAVQRRVPGADPAHRRRHRRARSRARGRT